MDEYRRNLKDMLDRRKKGGFKLKEGENTLRVLNTPKGVKSPKVIYEFAMHSEVGPDKLWLRCGKHPVTGKGKCWLCDVMIPKLEAKGKESRAAALRPQPKLVVQVASISDSGKWTGPFLWYTSGKLGDELISSILMSKKRDYTDHKKGFNLTITRTGTTFKNTRYSGIIPDLEATKVPSSILEKMKPFDELKEIAKYDGVKMKKAYFGESLDSVADDEDDDDDAKKSRKRGRDNDDYEEEDTDNLDEEDDDKPSRKKNKYDDDDDSDDDVEEDEDSDDVEEDEDSDDDEEDEDEDEKPRNKKKKGKVVKMKKRRPSNDDDDEDDDEDDED